jgi:hypothetical protein
MKKETSAAANSEQVNAKRIERLKTVFRKWYGSLSVRELVSNKTLVAEIEAFERLLSGKEIVSC